MEPLPQALMEYDWGSDRNALTPITARVSAAHDDPEARAELETQLVAVLESEAPLPAKEFVCRQLAVMGTAQSVPTLGGMLADPATSDMARMALEQIREDAAGAALRDALPTVSGLQRIGVVTSLGQRRDEAAVAAIRPLLGDADEALAVASAEALGQIASSQACEGLAEAVGVAEGRVRLAVLDAYLLCADDFVAENDKKKARSIYAALKDASMPKAIQMAAEQGLKNLNTEGAVS